MVLLPHQELPGDEPLPRAATPGTPRAELHALEDNILSRVNGARSGELARLQERLGSLEQRHHKMEDRVSELSGMCAYQSTLLSMQTKRTGQVEQKTQQWRRRLEEALQAARDEFEHKLREVACKMERSPPPSPAAASSEGQLRRRLDYLKDSPKERLETCFDENALTEVAKDAAGQLVEELRKDVLQRQQRQAELLKEDVEQRLGDVLESTRRLQADEPAKTPTGMCCQPARPPCSPPRALGRRKSRVRSTGPGTEVFHTPFSAISLVQGPVRRESRGDPQHFRISESPACSSRAEEDMRCWQGCSADKAAVERDFGLSDAQIAALHGRAQTPAVPSNNAGSCSTTAAAHDDAASSGGGEAPMLVSQTPKDHLRDTLDSKCSLEAAMTPSKAAAPWSATASTPTSLSSRDSPRDTLRLSPTKQAATPVPAVQEEFGCLDLAEAPLPCRPRGFPSGASACLMSPNRKRWEL
eukprot:TRINITY_DN17566_c0_g1_i2.p1 TRINITY_DN17566_c0_g1~~TRINITY_DN17566_c0_g1_i2.p1  ORF type:complete len:471 (+),score=116.62 TRINITY_DN17566_c0_g1_i2:185-1597(+)